MNKYIVLLVFACLNLTVGNCQVDSVNIDATPEIIFGLQLGISDGFIFAHSEDVANSKGSKPFGVELGISWLKNDADARTICNCSPKKGINIAYFDLDNKVYGKSLSSYYYLEPLYRVSRKTLFSFKGSLGLAYLTNPYDSILNPTNRGYSTAINFYLALGFGIWFKINDHWWINGNVSLQHISNGGQKLPNSGINWPTAGIVVSHQNKPMPAYIQFKEKTKYWKSFGPRYELAVFGMGSKVIDAQYVKHIYPILGFGAKASKQVSSLNALSLSAEIFSDQVTKNDLKKDSLDLGVLRAGLMIGNEFILGRFLFSQRLGAYIVNETTYSTLYHRWGLEYRISDNWGAGFNLLVHGRTADFFDLRLTYSFQRK